MAFDLTKILETTLPKELQNIQTLNALRDDYLRWEASDFKDVYDSNLKSGFKNISEFKKYLGSLGIQNASQIPNKYLGILVEKWYEKFLKEPQLQEQAQTTISEDELKEKIQKAEERLQQKEAIKQKQAETVQSGIKKQQELYEQAQQQLRQNLEATQKASEDLKDKVIYAQVTVPQTPTLDKDETEFYEKLKTNAQNPQEFLTNEGSNINTRLTELFGDKLSKEEIKTLADSTAADLASKLNPIQQTPSFIPNYTQTAILNALKEDNKILPSILKSEESISTFKNVSISQLLLQNDPERVHRIVAQLYMGKLAEYVYGPDPEKISVSFYTQPIANAYVINLEQVNSDAYQFQQKQSSALEHLSSLPTDQAQSMLLSSTKSYIEKKVESLPTQHAAKIIYNSDIGRMLLARYGLADPFVYQATNAFGRIALQYAPETAPYLAAAGRLTGFNIGLRSISGGAIAIAASSYTATATSVAVTGGIMASEAFLGGAGAAIGSSGAGAGAAAGALGGPLAWITVPLGAVAGALFGKAISKVQEKLPAIKQWIQDNAAVLGIGFGLGAFFIGGPLRPLLTVLGVTFGGIALATGGLAAVRAGVAGFWSVLTGIGGLIAIEIATPVIVTLIAIPPLIAFIMFVINSGAYLVPPFEGNLSKGGFTSPYVDMKKEPNPPGPFTNNEFPKEVTYKITITPKKGALSNVQLKYDCKIVSKANLKCPNIKIVDSNYADVFNKPIDSISPTGISFSYTSSYDNKYKDSAIIDSIQLTATSLESSNINAETSASVSFGKPPISCPLPGGKPLNSMSYSYNASNDTGHGSRPYWNAMGGSPYRYSLPQSTGCQIPGACSYYGYSYDVFPTGTTEIFAPTVEGKDIVWQCSYAFSNGTAGHTYKCLSNDGNYALVLTHMNKGAKTGIINSGGKIGNLFNQLGNTHLHLEFQANGRWQKPENYFCQQ